MTTGGYKLKRITPGSIIAIITGLSVGCNLNISVFEAEQNSSEGVFVLLIEKKNNNMDSI